MEFLSRTQLISALAAIGLALYVLDLVRGVMTYCRAGHTPLIFFRGAASGRPALARRRTSQALFLSRRGRLTRQGFWKLVRI